MKWITFVMKHKKPGMSLGDAMKEASKHKKEWKKGGGDEGGASPGRGVPHAVLRSSKGVMRG